MRRFLVLMGCLLASGFLMSQSTYTYLYWYDDNVSNSQQGVVGDGHLQLDLAALDNGLHWLNIMLKTDESISAPERHLFCKLSDGNTALDYYYWYDDDVANIQHNTIGDGHFLLDLSALNEGLHWLNIMLKSEENYSVPERHLFYKLPTGFEGAYRYWFDEDVTNMQSGTLGREFLLLDVSGLSVGAHVLNLQLENIVTGELSVPQRFDFTRISGNDVGEMSGDVLAIWPNPTSGIVRFKAESLEKIIIINPIGQCIYEGNVSEFDFSGREAGVYLIRIETASGVTTKQVVVTK